MLMMEEFESKDINQEEQFCEIEEELILRISIREKNHPKSLLNFYLLFRFIQPFT